MMCGSVVAMVRFVWISWSSQRGSNFREPLNGWDVVGVIGISGAVESAKCSVGSIMRVSTVQCLRGRIVNIVCELLMLKAIVVWCCEVLFF